MVGSSKAPDLSATLKKLSAHLDMLAGQIFSVEEALGVMLASKEAGERISITKFQSLDFTRQSLEDCALMLQLLSSDPSTMTSLKCNSGICDKLKLDATKGLIASGIGKNRRSKSGDFDLF